MSDQKGRVQCDHNLQGTSFNLKLNYKTLWSATNSLLTMK